MQSKWILGLLLLLVACQAEQSADATTEKVEWSKRLPGTWEVKYIRVEVESFEDTDSSYVFEIDENNWQKMYSIKPYRTYYSPDSTFRRLYRGLNEQPVSENRGLWNIFGDTLMMIQPNETLQYKIALEQGDLHMTGLVDWDKDGSEDDVYYSVQRYVGMGSNE